jgi:superfamily II DNA or RNA helicase
MISNNELFRYYQKEADEAIYEELQSNNKCLVKMFCGTGKSKLMRYCKVTQNKNLVVYVVPSLALLEQFYTDYFVKTEDFPLENILKISSEKGSTTENKEIVTFLEKKENKIICVTYQSFETLITALDDVKIDIDICIFDEAHHITSENYSSLIFETNVCEKQIFFTATPKNANGIVMYDKDNLDFSKCGKLVYDYSYFKGVMEGYLNPFEIRLDFYTENTNTSIYESIARAILASGNNRVLTFHSDVNGERDTSVLQFVDGTLFKYAFNKVQQTEFPEKIGFYKRIQMIGLHSDIGMKDRGQILKQFDTSTDNEVFIISSCQTIGEGIDTKNANMCVFVDPKTSIVGITQNIGRIVRKNQDIQKPNSTILIASWVDKEKYLECDGDKEKCDEVIRQDINKGGNFNGILNVMSALKQEDEDLFDACLNYPSCYSPQEIEGNLGKHGYMLEEPGSLIESLEDTLDTKIDLDEDNLETDEELLTRVAEDKNVVIEVHTNSLETPIEYYGEPEEGKEVVRIFKSYDEETEENVYQPIVKKDGSKRNTDRIEPLRRENRFNIKVHTNPDVKVLWNLTSDLDLSRDICSCIIDCEVVKYDPMEVAQGIVERAKEREKNGGNLLPKRCFDQTSIEYKDAIKLSRWKLSLKGLGTEKIIATVKEYLDNELPNWSDEIDLDKQSMINAQLIVERAKEREKNGGNLFPRCIRKKIDRSTSILEQENKDANKLSEWKQSLNPNYNGSSRKCPDIVINYLNINLPGWNIFREDENMLNVIDIVNRAKIRKQNGGELMPKNIRNVNANNEEKQEQYDARRLSQLKSYILGKNRRKCSDKIRDYLDVNLPGWRNEINFDKNALNRAKEIVDNSKLRLSNGGSLIPKKYNHINKENLTDIQKIERSDATKLGDWKKSLNGSKHIRCSNEVRDYLDEHLPGWRPIDDTTSIKETPIESVIQEEIEITVTPKQKKSAKLPKLTNPKEVKVETKEEISVRTKPLLTQFHNKLCKMRSDNLAQYFKENTNEFYEYHRVRDECFQTFKPEDIPCNRVILDLDKFKTKIGGKHVVDMGCGTAKISQYFKNDPRFNFTNYDHVAINDTVQVCDISNMPLEDDSVNICIMSLALWGPNCEEYVAEANRVLETNGQLYIIDSTKRWSEEGKQDGELLKQMLEKIGFQINEKDTRIDQWCYFKCIKKIV